MNATKGPYFDDKGRPTPLNSVVISVDILGYTQEVQRVSREEQQFGPFLEFLYIALRESLRYLGDPSQTTWYARMMTDDLLVAYPFPTNSNGIRELNHACMYIGHFQRKMTERALPVRGGISVGKIHVSELLFLPTEQILGELKEAQCKGGPPRVILMDSAKKLLTDHMGSLSVEDNREFANLLWPDEDTSRFVNYLRLRPRTKKQEQEKERENELLVHKEFIQRGLKEFARCPSICAKYNWIANYHNRFCRSVPELNTEEYLVPENLLGKL